MVADTDEGRDVKDEDPYWLASLLVLLNDNEGVVRMENGDERPDSCLDCVWLIDCGSTGD